MEPRRSASFVRGAMILSLAALLSRLLGALYKPVIARIFAPYDGHGGAVGLGLTQVPMTTYQLVLSFTSVGLNVGISKLVSERLALGDLNGARRAFRASLSIMTSLGLLAALCLWFGAPWVAGAISEDVADAIPGFRAIAPALLITSAMAAYRGLFQGFQQMAPSACSQIIEQVVRIASGVLLTALLVRVSVPMGAAGFNLGDVIGALAGFIYLLAIVRRRGRTFWQQPLEAASAEPGVRPAPLPGGWKLVRRIFGVAFPISLAGAVVPLMMQADLFFVFRALAAAGIRGEAAQAQYGLLTNAFMIVSLPAVLTTAVYTSIIPAVSAAWARGQGELARRRAQQAYRLTFLMAVPSQAGLWALASGVYALLFQDRAGGPVMAAISWATAPIMVQQTTSGILQGMGMIWLPVRNFLLGAVVKVGLTAVWTAWYGIDGAAWATAVGFGVAALLNLIAVERCLGRTLKTRSMLLKPLAAATAMAGVIRYLRLHLPEGGLITLLLILLGAGSYGLAMLLLGGVTRKDVEALPAIGRPVAMLLARTGVLR